MTLTDAGFEAVRELILKELGIHFEPHRRYLLEKRVASRMRALALSDFDTYFTRLRQGAQGEELQALTNALTVNETYFNREAYQFDCLTRSIIPEVIANRRIQGVSPREPVRIWSLPCSTGEEAYSIAMQLLDEWPSVDDHDVHIHASDVDTEALKAAREGIYGERTLRQLPPARRKRYFESIGGDRAQITSALRNSVRFSRVNLNEDDWLNNMPAMDVIFCRNLLIYFNDDTRQRAAERLFQALRPGGFICLGHSESMQRMNKEFLCRRFPEAIIYQRPDPRLPSLGGRSSGPGAGRMEAMAG